MMNIQTRVKKELFHMKTILITNNDRKTSYDKQYNEMSIYRSCTASLVDSRFGLSTRLDNFHPCGPGI